MNTARPLLFALLVTLITVPGCIFGPGGADPCEDDKFQCEEDVSAFKLDPSCTIEGTLEVQLGHGETGFQTLEKGALPIVHHGMQGGMHTFLALRVKNADLDRYDKLRVDLGLHAVKEHCGVDDRAIGVEPADTCVFDHGSRSLVLGHSGPMLTLPDGSVEEYGILMFVDSDEYSANPRYLSLDVQDPCGRKGSAIHDVAPAI